jgi:hypothetical protein
MSRKKKKEPESVLQGAKMQNVVEHMQPPDKRTSSVITVPLAIVAIAVAIFGLVKLIKWAWFF